MYNQILTSDDLKRNFTKIVCVNNSIYERLFEGEFKKVGHGERLVGWVYDWAYDCFQVNNQTCICIGNDVPFSDGYGISKADNEKVREYISYFEKFIQPALFLDYQSYEHYLKDVARAKRKCIKSIRKLLEC